MFISYTIAVYGCFNAEYLLCSYDKFQEKCDINVIKGLLIVRFLFFFPFEVLLVVKPDYDQCNIIKPNHNKPPAFGRRG